MTELSERLATKRITLIWDHAALEALLSHASSREYGAREIDRAIQSKVLAPIVERLTEAGGTVIVKAVSGLMEVAFAPVAR
jgi:ATP-dependent Clp protease ATP-binding subunit ClpA